MATFFENLWTSVFVPGTTPTLLIATNASFAALQLLLFTLLVTTYSVHFAVLSFLCGGLWWAINWFATELAKADAAEKEAGRLRQQTQKRKQTNEKDGEGSEMDEGDDETETETEGATTARSLPLLSQVRIRGGPQKILGVMHSAAVARGETTDEEGSPRGQVQIRGGPSKFEALLGKDGFGASQGSRKSLGEETGSVSTDSEW